MRNHAALAFDPKAFLGRIENGKSTREYRSRQVILSQGDAADAVFYVQSGKVKLTVVSTRGKEAVIGVLEQGSFFGEGFGKLGFIHYNGGLQVHSALLTVVLRD